MKCKAFLTLAHKFRQICHRSNEFLREYVVKDSCIDLETEKAQETEQYEQLEVEVLEEEIWGTEETIEDAAPPPSVPDASVVPPSQSPEAKGIPVVLAVETVPAPGTGKLYVCDICKNGYPRKSTLATHMRRHNNDRPYECE